MNDLEKQNRPVTSMISMCFNGCLSIFIVIFIPTNFSYSLCQL